MAVIYIRGPYSAPTEIEREANVRRAAEAAVECIRRGDAPLVPHFSHYTDLAAEVMLGERFASEIWMQTDFELLAKCDEVLPIGDSPGSLREAAFALGRRIPSWQNLEHYCQGRAIQDGR